MRKIIKKIGTSIGIIFNSEEQKIYGIKKGNVIQFLMGTKTKKGNLKDFHYKTIRKVGNSLGIIFNVEEVKVYGLKIDEIIQLKIKSISKIIK